MATATAAGNCSDAIPAGAGSRAFRLDLPGVAELGEDEPDGREADSRQRFLDVAAAQREPEGKRQRIVLRFLASPVEIQGDGKVESIVIGRNELVEEGGSLRARDTGEREELECGLVLRSVGYTGIPTVRHLLADVESQALLCPASPEPAAVEDLLAERGVRFVSFEDWQAIDQAEVGRGEPHGRPRVKFVRVEEMLETLGEKVSG